jgi:hypothetical protein
MLLPQEGAPPTPGPPADLIKNLDERSLVQTASLQRSAALGIFHCPLDKLIL